MRECRRPIGKSFPPSRPYNPQNPKSRAIFPIFTDLQSLLNPKSFYKRENRRIRERSRIRQTV